MLCSPISRTDCNHEHNLHPAGNDLNVLCTHTYTTAFNCSNKASVGTDATVYCPCVDFTTAKLITSLLVKII